MGATDNTWRPYNLRGITISVPELGSKSVALEVATGINVLYGLNGVGKSRVLSAIPDATFDLYAPILSADGTRTNPLWRMEEMWSFGHELELHWPERVYEDDTSRQWFDDSFEEPLSLVFGLTRGYRLADWDSVIDALAPVKNSDEDPLVRAWVIRLAYWVAEIQRLSSQADHKTVLDAITALVHQGRLRLKRDSEAAPESAITRWEVEYFAEVVPDEARLWRWAQIAAERVVQQALDPGTKSSDHVGVRAEDAILGSDLGRLCSDVVYDTVDLLLAGVPGYPTNYLGGLSTAPIYEIFSRKITDNGRHPINFISDTAQTLADDALRHIQQLVDASPAFHDTEPSHHWNISERAAQLQEFMFGPIDAPRISQETRRAAATLSKAANRELQRLLIAANPIRARLPEPGEWPTLGKIIWESEDRQGQWVPLEVLSETQQRLAALAIKVATYASTEGISILILDEPERGLHRLAERHLLDGLHELTELYPDLIIIVASHSPSFLRPDIARLHHVERDAGGAVQVNRMPTIPDRDLAKLGMSASDLLQLTRLVILVEGQHDEWVLRHSFGDEFDAMGVKVMSMRGANRLISAADGTLLFDYTEAHLIVMLDRTKQDRIDQIWNEALVIWDEHHRVNDVVRVLDKLLPRKRSLDQLDGTTEGAALKDFCAAVITRGRQDRISFVGLRKDDIQDYYSPAFFTTLDDPPSSFAELRKEWKHLRGAGQKVGNFKEWARQAHGMRFTEHNFKRAVKNSDLHPDFQALFKKVSDLSDLLD